VALEGQPALVLLLLELQLELFGLALLALLFLELHLDGALLVDVVPERAGHRAGLALGGRDHVLERRPLALARVALLIGARLAMIDRAPILQRAVVREEDVGRRPLRQRTPGEMEAIEEHAVG